MKVKLHLWLRKWLPLCRGHHGPCWKLTKKRRQDTQYHDDSKNWVRLCPEHLEEVNDCWAMMWAEYYRGCM